MRNGEEETRDVDGERKGSFGDAVGGWEEEGNRRRRSYRTDAGSASTSRRRMKSESPTLVIIRPQKAPTVENGVGERWSPAAGGRLTPQSRRC